jgi:hypothetical protein
MDYLKTADLNTLGLWLSPDFMVPLARFHGNGDPILGANQAYKEVRGLIRGYAKYIRWRENKRGEKDIGLAKALRALGYAGGFQRIVPLRDPSLFRKTAFSFWPKGTGGDVLGVVEIGVGDATEKQVRAATIKAVSQMLAEKPELNLAVLDQRVWQRRSPEVMLNISIRGEIRSIVFSASKKTLKEIDSHLFRAMRRLVEIEGHPLRFMTNQLLELWSEYYNESGTGYIASVAGAMLTFIPAVGGIDAYGWSRLCLFNGIPLSLNVANANKGSIKICTTPSHLAFDGQTIANGYAFLQERIPKLLEET